MSSGPFAGYSIEPDPFDVNLPEPPLDVGQGTPDVSLGGLLRCTTIPGTGQSVVDPGGQPTADTVPGSERQECCLPICGVTPTAGDVGGFPPDGSFPPTSPTPTEPSRPEPGETTRDLDVPPVGDPTKRCGVDAYQQWARLIEEQGVGQALRILRSLVYGSINQESDFVKEIEKHETSLFPSRQFQGTIQRFLHSTVTRIDEVIGGWVAGGGCLSAEHSLLTVQDALLNILQLAFGTSLGFLSTPVSYKKNAMCPVCYPTHQEALDCFLRGSIDRDTYETWVKQNNYCVEPWDRVVESRQSRLTPTDMLAAWRREMMSDSRIDKELRNLGFIDEDFREWMRKLTEFVSPIQDVIRFMVRDTEDVDIVERFGLDSEFEAKWQGLAQRFGRWQGISDETAKRYWRAHWQIPSPTQLFEMYHVSRSLPDGDPAKTTLPEIETTLKQQDILPYWIPKLLATTYSRMSRVDVRRAYNLGVLTKDQVLNLYRRLGYREEDAASLTEWTSREKIRSAAGRRKVKLFSQGLVSRNDATLDLISIGLTHEEASGILDDVLLVVRAKVMSRCLASLRKRYLLGELTQGEYTAELFQQGLTPEYVNLLRDSAECERAARGKLVPTATLCKWYDDGLIDSLEYNQRLVKIGWDQDDALKIIRQCSGKISERRAKEAEKLARQEAAAVERERRRAERDAAKAQRAAKQSQRAREIQAKARARRQQLLGRATELLAQHASVSPDQAGGAVQDAMSRLSSQFLLTADTRVQAVVLAVEKFKPDSVDAFRQRVLELADELEALATLPGLE